MPMPPPPPDATPMMPEAAPATDTFIRRQCFLVAAALADTATVTCPGKEFPGKWHWEGILSLIQILITIHRIPSSLSSSRIL